MKKIVLYCIVFLVSLVIGVTTFLYLNRAKPLLFKYDPEIGTGSIRPRNYCVMNPFRDTIPEKIAASYMTRMRDGNVDIVAPFIKREKEDIPHMLDNERTYPIQSWRIGDRKDKDNETEIMFWVKRGGNYSGEESVWFWLTHSGDVWTMTGYNAIY